MASETGPIDAETQIEEVRIDIHEADVVDVDGFDVSGSCDAMLGQFRATTALVVTLDRQQALLPTRLGSWRVIELVSHLSGSLDLVLRATESSINPAAEVSPLRWYRHVDDSAQAIDAETREAASVGWTQVRDTMEHHLAEVTDLLASEDPNRMVTAYNDTMTLEAFCATRCVEAVLHTLDLGAALSTSARLDPRAVAIVRRFVAVAEHHETLTRPELRT
jgi:uncharacterized protein (TIGR03083 family)